MTYLRLSRTILSEVILITDKTRILRCAFRTIIGRILRRFFLRHVMFIFTFPFLLTLLIFLCRGGLDNVNFLGFPMIGWTLRSNFSRRNGFLLRRSRGRLSRRLSDGTNNTIDRRCRRSFRSSRLRGIG